MTKLILMTGSGGFVGKHVLHYLLKEDVLVKLVLREGHINSVCDSKIESVIYTKNLFLESHDWWLSCLKGVDVVLHLAWYAKPGSYLSAMRNLECHFGTIKLGMAVAHSGVQRFIGIGTCMEYAKKNSQIEVNDSLHPYTFYGKAKRATYLHLKNLFLKSGVGFSWARLFYLHGESDNAERLLPYIREKLALGLVASIRNGHSQLDYLDVDEAGKELARLVINEYDGAVNICSGSKKYVKDLALSEALNMGRPDLLSIERGDVLSTSIIYGCPTKF